MPKTYVEAWALVALCAVPRKEPSRTRATARRETIELVSSKGEGILTLGSMYRASCLGQLKDVLEVSDTLALRGLRNPRPRSRSASSAATLGFQQLALRGEVRES